MWKLVDDATLWMDTGEEKRGLDTPEGQRKNRIPQKHGSRLFALTVLSVFFVFDFGRTRGTKKESAR